MDAQLSGHTPRRTRETEEKRRQNPVRQRPPTLVEQGIGEVVEGKYLTKNNFILFPVILDYSFYVVHQMCPAFIGV